MRYLVEIKSQNQDILTVVLNDLTAQVFSLEITDLDDFSTGILLIILISSFKEISF